jgi:ribosomal-protein-alanine N-acetyltransferase
MITPVQMAALHGACFNTTPPPWSASAFAGLMDSPLVFTIGDTRGFVMGRAAAGEAEVLTLAIAPDARRQGLARQLMLAFHSAARSAGAEAAFLEVAQDNAAAVALYLSIGYAQAGRRRGYYTAPGGGGVDALVMTRALI